jgi:glutamine---fructose-6-phosphate transaminase (isomerizing)
MSLLREEIAEQPAVLERLLEAQAVAVEALAAGLRRRPPRFALIAARGSSDNVARYAQHVLGRLCRIPVALATPSLHTLYATPPRLDGALVVGISQSGASPDVNAVVADGARQAQVTVAITNDAGSPMASAADHVIELGTGPERSVAATKTYTASVAAVAALAAAVAGAPGLREELLAAPAAVAAQLQRPVEVELDWERCAVIGRGANYATAFEAALKIKELAGVAAEPASPADFLHGPVAMLDPGFPVLAILPSAVSGAAIRDVLAAAHARDADVTVIGDAPGERQLAVEPVPEWLSPLCAVVPAQLLAVGAAERRGVDVDRPVGLQKVTRTH